MFLMILTLLNSRPLLVIALLHQLHPYLYLYHSHLEEQLSVG